MLKQIIVCGGLLFATAATAQDMPQTMEGMDMRSSATDAPSTKEFKSGMATMGKNMGHYTGDADRDFVINMIPHHQGAIDMAKTELKYGSDPKLKKLAMNIVAAQQKEIAYMKEWLEKHPAAK